MTLPEWNYDMEAAPKDGRALLVALDFGSDPLEVAAVRYKPDSLRSGPFGRFVWRPVAGGDAFAEQVAKAWQPLPAAPLKAVRAKLDERVSAFARAEEARQRQEAAEARQRADEAAKAAAEAARVQREADENAAAGEIGVDLVAATVAEQTAAKDAARADREAQRAERNIGVRLPTGLGRATSLRAREVLTVTDPVAAVGELGLTPDLEEAIRKSSIAFRKLRGKLPAGVTAATERSI